MQNHSATDSVVLGIRLWILETKIKTEDKGGVDEGVDVGEVVCNVTELIILCKNTHSSQRAQCD